MMIIKGTGRWVDLVPEDLLITDWCFGWQQYWQHFTMVFTIRFTHRETGQQYGITVQLPPHEAMDKDADYICNFIQYWLFDALHTVHHQGWEALEAGK